MFSVNSPTTSPLAGPRKSPNVRPQKSPTSSPSGSRDSSPVRGGSEESAYDSRSPLLTTPVVDRNRAREPMGSNASTRSDTEQYLSPAMREVYRSLRLEQGSSRVRGETHLQVATELDLESARVVQEAIAYRADLEGSVARQKAELGILQKKISKAAEEYAQLTRSNEELDKEITHLQASLKKTKEESANELKKSEALKKMNILVMQTKSDLTVEKVDLEREIESLKKISAEATKELEKKISEPHKARVEALLDELSRAQEKSGSVSAELAREKVRSEKYEVEIGRLTETLSSLQSDLKVKDKAILSHQSEIAKLQQAIKEQAVKHARQLSVLSTREGSGKGSVKSERRVSVDGRETRFSEKPVDIREYSDSASDEVPLGPDGVPKANQLPIKEKELPIIGIQNERKKERLAALAQKAAQKGSANSVLGAAEQAVASKK